ncbi:MAG: immunoglobulin domain-containing protein [Planctomycetota bacterium]
MSRSKTDRCNALLIAAGAAALFASAASGQRVLIDFGDNGGLSPVALPGDANGNLWNNFNPGQFIRLQDTAGGLPGSSSPNGIGMGLTTGGGDGGGAGEALDNPDPLLLGDLAVATATSDFLFRFDDLSGSPETLGIEFSSLDPSETYNFRFFGSRISSETRETQYTVIGGGGTESIALITSGTNIGSDGMSFANDNVIVSINGVTPQANGTIVLEVDRLQSNFFYLNALELQVVSGLPVVDFTAQPASVVANAGGTLSFTAEVADGTGVTFQWQRDGVDLADGIDTSGATTASLTINNAGLDDVGEYTLVASSGGASTSSDVAVGAVRQSTLGLADFNGNGMIDFFDVLDFLVEFDAAAP